MLGRLFLGLHRDRHGAGMRLHRMRLRGSFGLRGALLPRRGRLFLRPRGHAAVHARIGSGGDLVIDLASRALLLHLADDDGVSPYLTGLLLYQPDHVGFRRHASGKMNRSEVAHVSMRRMAEGLDRAADFSGLDARRDHVRDDESVGRQHRDLRLLRMCASRYQQNA